MTSSATPKGAVAQIYGSPEQAMQIRKFGFFDPAPSPPQRHRFILNPDASANALLRDILRSAAPYSLIGMLLVMTSNLGITFIPVLLGHIVDAVLTPLVLGVSISDTWPALAWALAGLSALYMVIVVATRLGGRIGWYGMQRTQHEISQQLTGRALERGNADRLPGELVSRLTVDIRQACQVIYVLVYPPGNIAQIISIAAIFFIIHPSIGIALLVSIPIIAAGIYPFIAPIQDRIEDELEVVGQAAGNASDTLLGLRTIHGLHAGNTVARRYQRINRRAQDAAIASRSAEAAFEGASIFASGLIATTLIALAVFLIGSGELTAGEFVSVVALSMSVTDPLSGVAYSFVGVWVSSRGAAKRLLALIHSNEDGAQTSDRDVFSPPTGILTVAHANADMVTTLCHGLTGQDGVLIVPQSTQLLAGSIIDNVAVDSGVASPQAIQALEIACLSETELPDGYASDTGENGSRLSGGQRQRVALARALYVDAPTLVLIEPTSSVDAVTERDITKRLADFRRGKTTLIVTDSAAFIAIADQVVSL
ncbi:MAG: ABC transporter ATP-binding protein [Actinomycetaceae bacterium]|nr:ABC transporter ATP-binding protein [Actinomycetaceae bacterium]